MGVISNETLQHINSLGKRVQSQIEELEQASKELTTQFEIARDEYRPYAQAASEIDSALAEALVADLNSFYSEYEELSEQISNRLDELDEELAQTQTINGKSVEEIEQFSEQTQAILNKIRSILGQ